MITTDARLDKAVYRDR